MQGRVARGGDRGHGAGVRELQTTERLDEGSDQTDEEFSSQSRRSEEPLVSQDQACPGTLTALLGDAWHQQRNGGGLGLPGNDCTVRDPRGPPHGCPYSQCSYAVSASPPQSHVLRVCNDTD